VSQPRVEAISFTPSARISATLSELQRDAAWRRPLRQQIILPFLLLLALVAAVGVAALTYQTTSSGMAGFDQGLVRESVQANDRLAMLEAGRLNDLRALAATPGLATAVEAKDGGRLSALLGTDTRSALEAHLLIRIFDQQGRSLLSIPEDKAQRTYDSPPAITQVLSGAIDARGDKYLAVVPERLGQVVYWSAPIRDPHRQVIGAVLLGESITDIAAELRPAGSGRLFFYGPTGQSLDASLPALSIDVRQSITSDHLMRVSASASGHAYALAVTDWMMRGERFGYLGVGLPADGVVDNVLRLRLFILGVFLGMALLVLVAGGLLARRISLPLERLVSSMKTLAASDLTHSVPPGHADEIAYLTSSFNTMSARLEEKTRALEMTSFASIEALARAIDARDPYTYGHSARVARLSAEIADEMGLPIDQLIALSRASLLHDIGKIGVEDRVLRKPGPLDKREMAAMREHPVIGYEMLRGLHFLESSLDGVRHHHEHWDGSGYPDGINGNVIPLAVRILTVADALDALTSDRPYRLARSLAAAVTSIAASAEKQFDPDVVRALVSRGDAIAALLMDMGKPHTMPVEPLKEPAR
jgi:putative nucleotidyltransferase with HDIG domain